VLITKFFGNQAGRNAINAYQSNFIGYQAGYQATSAYAQISWVIKLVLTTGAFYSNFFGNQAGSNATVLNQTSLVKTGAYATNAYVKFLWFKAG
jgi:hypothetical protein